MKSKDLPQRELKLSAKQDSYPNFCNKNITFGSKVMVRVKFFFLKVGQICGVYSNVCNKK